MEALLAWRLPLVVTCLQLYAPPVCSYRHAVAPCICIRDHWRMERLDRRLGGSGTLAPPLLLSLQRRRRAPGSETGGQGDQGFNSLSPSTFQRLEKAQSRNGSYPPCIMLIPWSSLPSKKASFMHVNSTHPLSDPVPGPVRSMRLLPARCSMSANVEKSSITRAGLLGACKRWRAIRTCGRQARLEGGEARGGE